MIITRKWAMPNKNTFSIKPIAELLSRYLLGVSIDPFANSSKLASITNDIDPDYDTTYHLDALDFLKMYEPDSIDTVLFDPPYSTRQVSECYRKMKLTVNMQTTQGSFWRKLKEEISRIVKPGGHTISCSWNSGGIGKKFGFEISEILLVPHGGWHNDTIITVDKRS